MPYKILIEVVSCKKDRPKQWVARDTWVKEWGHLVDYKFLLGEGNEDPQDDEWIFPVGDSWDAKTRKVQASHRRALLLDYDYVFHVSLDCYPIVPRLLILSRMLEGHPYVGTKSGGGDFLGEAGFWLGREALRVIAQAPEEDAPYDDLWMGQQLCKAGIHYRNEPNYRSGDQNREIFPYASPEIWLRLPPQASVHLGRGSGKFDPQWMLDCHQSYMDNGDHIYLRPGL